MKKPIIACAVQQPCNRGRETNLAYSLSQIEQAAKQNADLVVLPELHLDHYFCQSEDTACFDLAQAIPGPTCETLSQAAKTHQVVIVSTIFEKRAPGLYHNTAVVFDKDGSIAGTFRKMHIPDDPGFYEKFYFTPGDLGFKPITTSIGKLGHSSNNNHRLRRGFISGANPPVSEKSVSRISTIVTSLPAPTSTAAVSQPTAPAPATTIFEPVFALFSSTSTALTTLSRSIPGIAGIKGEDPVARITTSGFNASTFSLLPSVFRKISTPSF